MASDDLHDRRRRLLQPERPHDHPWRPAGIAGGRLAVPAELKGDHYGALPLLLLRPDQSIDSRHDIEADNDDDAIAKASVIVASDDNPTIEVWDGARLVGQLGEPKRARELRQPCENA